MFRTTPAKHTDTTVCWQLLSVHRVISGITSKFKHDLTLPSTPLQPYAIDIHLHFPVSASLRRQVYHSALYTIYSHTASHLNTHPALSDLHVSSSRPAESPSRLTSKTIVAICDPPDLGRWPEHIFWPAAPILRPSAGLVDGAKLLWPAAATIQNPSLRRVPTMMKQQKRRLTTAER